MGMDTFRITCLCDLTPSGLGEIPDPQLNPVVLLMTVAQGKTRSGMTAGAKCQTEGLPSLRV